MVSAAVEMVLTDLMVMMHLLKVVNLEPVAAVVVDLVILSKVLQMVVVVLL